MADVDGNALTTTLTVANGTLNVTAGRRRHRQRQRHRDPLRHAAQINAALAGLAYTGNLNFNGADTLTVATSDGTATDTDTVAITVNAVNDAPVNTVPGAQSVNEDTIAADRRRLGDGRRRQPLTTTLTVANGIAQRDRRPPASPATAAPP